MAKLLDPEGTVCILLGASDWTKAGRSLAPSFGRSAAYFHRYLLQALPNGLGFYPDAILNLFDDPAPASAQLGRIKKFVEYRVQVGKQDNKRITDLLIYYIGHGTSEDGEALYLLVADSAEGIETQSSISTLDLAKVLRVSAPQQRRIVILDCCFSEAAVSSFAAMSAGFDEAVSKLAGSSLISDTPDPKRGTLLLCSSPKDRVSRGIPTANRTLFTGSLLQLLQQGCESRDTPMLSFADVRDDVFQFMLESNIGEIVPARPSLHQPDQKDGDLTRLPAFPNAFYKFRGENGKCSEEARRTFPAEGKNESTTRQNSLQQASHQREAQATGSYASLPAHILVANAAKTERSLTSSSATPNSKYVIAALSLLMLTTAGALILLSHTVVEWPSTNTVQVSSLTDAKLANPNRNETAVSELISNSDSATILAQAKHRMTTNPQDAMLLLEAGAGRHYLPALVALGSLYDPNLPRQGGIPADARQAAKFYSEATRIQNDIVSSDREALMRTLVQQREQGDLSAKLTLQDYWR